MGRHNRGPMDRDEEVRLETLNEKILAALQKGPCTNKELVEISFDYGRRIRDLRNFGHRIASAKLDKGLNLYSLRTDEEPLWEVPVQVTLKDGNTSVQFVHVRGDTIGLVKNRAQHMATRVKVGEPVLMTS